MSSASSSMGNENMKDDFVVVQMTKQEKEAFDASKKVLASKPSAHSASEVPAKNDAIHATGSSHGACGSTSCVPLSKAMDITFALGVPAPKTKVLPIVHESKDEQEADVEKIEPITAVLPHHFFVNNGVDSSDPNGAKYKIFKQLMNVTAKSGIAHVKGGAIRDIVLHGAQIQGAMEILRKESPVAHKDMYHALPVTAFITPNDLDVDLVDDEGKQIVGKQQAQEAATLLHHFLVNEFGASFTKQLSSPHASYNGAFWRWTCNIRIPTLPLIRIEMVAQPTNEEKAEIRRELQETGMGHRHDLKQPSFGKVLWDFECNSLVFTKTGIKLSETFMASLRQKDDILYVEQYKEKILQDIRNKTLKLNREIERHLLKGDAFFIKRLASMLTRGWHLPLYCNEWRSEEDFAHGTYHLRGDADGMVYVLTDEQWRTCKQGSEIHFEYHSKSLNLKDILVALLGRAEDDAE